MDKTIVLPFVSFALIAAAAVGAAAAWNLLPQRVGGLLRWGAIAASALAAAGLAIAIGVPWRGSLHLSWYGVCMLAAFLAGWLTMQRRCAAIGVDRQRQADIGILALLGGMLGARLMYLLERPGVIQADYTKGGLGQVVASALDIDGGGMVWYGGVALATAALWIYAKRVRLPRLALADTILPSLLLGLAIGRVGCFFNGCCFGQECHLPWAVPHVGGHGTVLVHPTQLYETAVCLILAVGLAWYWRRRRQDGAVTLLAIVGYAAWRFVNEFLRDHGPLVETPVLGLNLTTAQLISICLIAASVGVWAALRGRTGTEVPGSRYAKPAA